MTHRPLLLRGARQLLTLRGPAGPRRGAASLDLGIIRDGSVLVRAGRIVAVGPTRRLENLAEARGAEVYEAQGAVVMPAWVDAAAAVPPVPVQWHRLFRLAQTHGTSAIGGAICLAAGRQLPSPAELPVALVPFHPLAPEIPPPQRSRVPKVSGHRRVEIRDTGWDALHAVSRTGGLLRAFRGPQAPPDWIGLALACGAGQIEISSSLDDRQRLLLADAAEFAVCLPSAAVESALLLERGATIALATGQGLDSLPSGSMLTAALLAEREGRLPLATAILSATLHSALAIGLGNVRGSIESGKAADLLVLQVADYRELPEHFGANLVERYFRAGKLVK